MNPRYITLIAGLLLVSACGYSPKSPGEALNTRAPIDIVEDYFRALESGQWDNAAAFLADNYRFRSEGDSWLGRSRKKHIIPAYQAWGKAFPNFRFNEELLERTGNGVRLGVYYTGTHMDTLSIPRSGLPLLDSTGKYLRFPVEYHTYYVEQDKIVYTRCEVPPGHGETAILEALLPEPDTSQVH